MKEIDVRIGQIAEWMARLPFSGEPEFAKLIGADEHDVRRAVHELVRRGWAESTEPGSPELEARRRYFIRPAAVPALGAAAASVRIAQVFPLRRTDLLRRAGRIEITTGVNRLLADIADAFRSDGIAELADARSLPLGLRLGAWWWLPGLDGYGCLQAGDLWAPFFVAWDRASAPDTHRRQRVRGWSRARSTVAQQWGLEGLPPMLLICPSPREQAVWERAFQACADDGLSPPTAIVTTREALLARGVGEPIWRRVSDSGAAPLVEFLGWGSKPPVTSPLADAEVVAATQPPRTGASLRQWALVQAVAPPGRQERQCAAALALTAQRAEQVLIDWIARHPLLTAADLSALTGEPLALVERRLEWALRCHAICVAHINTADGEVEARYILTERGMRCLAERAGVPAAIFAKHAGIRYFDPRRHGCPEEVIRFVEHTIGVNRFVVRLAVEARVRGGHLLDVRNEAESARRFMARESRRSWIRPDASGVLVCDGEHLPFLLEYDRGTLDRGDYQAKLRGYRRYYGVRAWDEDFGREPCLLFVAADDRAEHRVDHVAGSAGTGGPTFITTEWRYDAEGTLGAIWLAEGTHRVSFLPAAEGSPRRAPTRPSRRWSREQTTREYDRPRHMTDRPFCPIGQPEA